MWKVSDQQVRGVGRWGVMCVLFFLALVVRGFRGWQEEIANPDAIRYVDQARGLATDFFGTLRGEVYHPLHAGLAALVHGLLRAGGGGLAWR